LLLTTSMIAAMMLGACQKQNQGPLDKAVENTKDALDVRDHEKLKDAGENVSDAAKDLKQGVKDAVDGK
jgi:hypothetical protein